MGSIGEAVSQAAVAEVTAAIRAALDGIPTGRLVLAMDAKTPVGRVVSDYLWSL